MGVLALIFTAAVPSIQYANIYPVIVDGPDRNLGDRLAAVAFVEQGAEPLGLSEATIFVNDGQRLRYDAIRFDRSWIDHDDGTRSPHWTAKWRSARGDEIKTRYADITTCPALGDVLVMLENLEPPRPDFEGLPYGAGPVRQAVPLAVLPPGSVPAGPNYTVRSRAIFANDGLPTEISMTGTHANPAGVWARVATAALEPCWSSDQFATGTDAE